MNRLSKDKLKRKCNYHRRYVYVYNGYIYISNIVATNGISLESNQKIIEEQLSLKDVFIINVIKPYLII
jgi:hypothetical protein